MAAIDTSQLSSIGVSGQPEGKKKNTLGQEAFLKLLTTQLQNQDPTKPLESGDFLGQMAQFGTVSGIQELQKSVQSLVSALSSKSDYQVATLVGKSVLTATQQVYGDQATGISGAVDVPQAASDVGIRILNQNGTVVKTISLGPQQAGRVQFNWPAGVQGPGPGVYKVEGYAVIGGKTEALKSFTNNKVESVSMGINGQEARVNLKGVGGVPVSGVLEIK